MGLLHHSDDGVRLLVVSQPERPPEDVYRAEERVRETVVDDGGTHGSGFITRSQIAAGNHRQAHRLGEPWTDSILSRNHLIE